jgi:serine/threonine-protein phosphatase 2B catalytic subunit
MYPDWKLIMNHFHQSGIMAKEAIIRLIKLAMETFSISIINLIINIEREPNIV